MSTEVKQVIDYASEAADAGGCPGGVIRYAQTEPPVIAVPGIL